MILMIFLREYEQQETDHKKTYLKQTRYRINKQTKPPTVEQIKHRKKKQ